MISLCKEYIFITTGNGNGHSRVALNSKEDGLRVKFSDGSIDLLISDDMIEYLHATMKHHKTNR